MFSPLRSLENHYATKTLREHRKAGQHYAEGDVEGFHKHEHRALRAARHADSVRNIGGEKENTTRTMSGGFGAPLLKAPVAPLQQMPTHSNMYLVPQLQVIPLAPVVFEEIQSAPSMTSLTSSPFGQNVLLGGPMDFPAATSFSSDQGCGLPPLTYSRSFDAPLDATYASALSASVAPSQAAVQELQAALIDRETRMALLQEARSYDQAELTVLRQQVEQMRAELEAKKSKHNGNNKDDYPTSPSSVTSSSDSQDDGLGENDGSLRRPFAFNTNIFPMAEEGTLASLNGTESSRLDQIFPPAFPPAAGGLPDGGLGYGGGFGDLDEQLGSPIAQLPPRVGGGIPFVQSLGEFPGQLGGPGMMSGFGFNDRLVPQSTTSPSLPAAGTLPGGEMIADSPAAGASATSHEDWSASAAYNPYLLSPRSDEYFSGLEVTSKNVTEEPTSAVAGAGARAEGGDVYKRLLLPTGGDDEKGKQKLAGSDPFAPPPPIEVSGVEGDVESTGQPPRHHHHHHHHRHHVHHLHKPNPSGHHGGSGSRTGSAGVTRHGSAPPAVMTSSTSTPRGRSGNMNAAAASSAATSSPRVTDLPARSRSERKVEESEHVEQLGSDAAREVNFYKNAKPTPNNTLVLSDATSGASAPPPRTL